jgi:hypothetical protein
MKDLKHIKRFNETEENLNISDVSRSFKVIFEGFETEEQAKTFADWYEGQGEQDSAMWLENIGIVAANVDMDKYHKQGGFIANENNEIIVPLRLYK